MDLTEDKWPAITEKQMLELVTEFELQIESASARGAPDTTVAATLSS